MSDTAPTNQPPEAAAAELAAAGQRAVEAGDYPAARMLLERSLLLHERLFGPAHPNTAWVLVNLGDLDQQAGDHAAARERYTRALIIREPALGARHPLTIHALRQLVAAFGDAWERDPAAMRLGVPLYQCLAALDAGTAAQDPLRALGASLGEDQAAAQLHRLVAQLADEQRRPPATDEAQDALGRAAALERQAADQLAAGAPAAARAALEEAIALREGAQGPQHLDLVAPLRALEEAMARLGRPSAVLPLRERAVAIQVQALGAGHPLALKALTELMALVSFEHGPEAAGPLQERILSLLEGSLGPDAAFTKLIRARVEQMRAVSPASGEPPGRSRSERREAALNTDIALAAELLADLEATPWRRLTHACGPAEDVPGLLRMLLSDDGEVRDEAFEELYDSIGHQDTACEASAYAVPFLLRMLADPRTPDRGGVLGLLSALARGSSYRAAHHGEGDGPPGRGAQLAAQGEDLGRQKELGYARAAHEAVAAGLDLLLALVESREEERGLRYEALALLAALPSRAGLSLPRLRALLQREGPSLLRTGLVRALHDLDDNSPEARQRFAELLAAEEPGGARLVAAVALLARAGGEAPAGAEAAVLEALGALGAHRHQLEALPEERAAWQAAELRFSPAWAPSPLKFGVVGLLALGGGRSRAALLAALRLQRDPKDAEVVAIALLDQAFPPERRTHSGKTYSRDQATGRQKVEYWGGTPQPARQASDLSPAQRELLIALAEHGPLWEHRSNLLELYGWPPERAALRRLLGIAGGTSG